eukprot:jgi/Botrbrau1/3922/Bobra.0183s0142.2
MLTSRLGPIAMRTRSMNVVIPCSTRGTKRNLPSKLSSLESDEKGWETGQHAVGAQVSSSPSNLPTPKKQRKARTQPSPSAVEELLTPQLKDRVSKIIPGSKQRTTSLPLASAQPCLPIVTPVVASHTLPPIIAWTPECLQTASAHLASVDPRLAPLIAEHGIPERLLPKGFDNMFATLARSIVYQQLAGSAALKIYERFLDVCQSRDPVQAAAVLAAPLASLRGCGLSERKASYLQDLARHFCEGHLSDELIAEFSDEALVTELTKVKGIGRWTVDMFAMFHLGRPDVLPLGDLAVRKGIVTLYDLKGTPSLEALEAVGSKWAPYRSLGSYYMWKVVTPRSPSKAKGKKS